MMNEKLTSADSRQIDPRDLSVLAYIRVRSRDVDELTDVFVAWSQNELLTLLRSLCDEGFLLRDISGQYWLTDRGHELLESLRVIAAFECDRMVDSKSRTVTREQKDD